MGNSEFGLTPKPTDCDVVVYEVSGALVPLPKCEATEGVVHSAGSH